MLRENSVYEYDTIAILLHFILYITVYSYLSYYILLEAVLPK